MTDPAEERVVEEPLFTACPVLESYTLPELSTILVREDDVPFLLPAVDTLPDDTPDELLLELPTADVRPDVDVLLPLANEVLPTLLAELVLYDAELRPTLFVSYLG